jgi:hypothetical protein
MPKDFLFPPLTGASRLITLTANSAFAPAMLGAMVDLNGYQLNLAGATGYGFFILTGNGTLIGAATATLGPTQAMMVAVEDGVFHFIDQPDIDLSALNAQIALKAPINNPTFTGVPSGPTAAQGTSTTQFATTAFVTVGLAGKSAVGHTHTFSGVDGLQSAIDGINSTLAIKANVASPSLTGTPTAPTAAPGTNTTQLATTAFVTAAISGLSGGASSAWGNITGSIAAQGDLAAALTDAKNRTNHTGTQAISTVTDLQNQLNLRAPIASPTFTGVPAVPTAAPGTNTTQAASTAFVTTLVSGEVGAINSALALKAPLASPAFTGIPTVPTAAPGTNTTQAASTAFVQAAVAGVSGGAGLPVITRNSSQGPPVSGADFNASVYVSGITSPAFSGYLLPVTPTSQPYIDYEWTTSGTLTPAGSGLWAKLYRHLLITPENSTVNAVAPKGNYLATGDQSTASEIQVYNGSWTIYWLYDDAGTARWVSAADAGMASQDAAVIPAGAWIFCTHRKPGVTPPYAFQGGVGQTWQTSPIAIYNWIFQLYNNGVSLGSLWGEAAAPSGVTEWGGLVAPSFTGTPDVTEESSTPAAGIGQKCRVGPYALTGGRTEVYDWFIAETADPVSWRQIDETQSPTATNILAALAALDAGQITSLRAILSAASVNLNPLP